MNQNIKGNEPDADLDALVHKLNEAIEDARSKMTDKQRQEADRRADAILERASSSASVSRHIA
jgi:vacuolar-type H+-ATPase subunit H